MGVDIFFVVSGYLMAVLYKNQSTLEFFTRRAKRLLPAYYVVIVATLIANFMFNTPNETKQVVDQSLYSSLFLSNFGFWYQNSYFSKDEFNPLLHLWSLAVEVQFYLIVPLLAWLFSKSKLYLPLVILASLSTCFIALTVSPKTSFFITPFRVWEFLFGYAVASYYSNNSLLTSWRWLGAGALIFIFTIPAFHIDGKSLSFLHGHPGLFSLLVVAATAVILAFGLPKSIEYSLPAKVLSKIGDYSYSIYLVHFPVIVIGLSAPFSGTVLEVDTLSQAWPIVFIIVVGSLLLHKFVEKGRPPSKIWRSSLLASFSVVIIALLLSSLQSFSISDEERKIFGAFENRSEYRCGKLVRITDPSAVSCSLSLVDSESSNSVLLVGNSHADSIKTTFSSIAAEYQREVFFMVANNPLMNGGGGTLVNSRRGCE